MRETSNQIDLVEAIKNAEQCSTLVSTRMSEHQKMKEALERIREESFDPNAVDIAYAALE